MLITSVCALVAGVSIGWAFGFASASRIWRKRAKASEGAFDIAMKLSDIHKTAQR